MLVGSENGRDAHPRTALILPVVSPSSVDLVWVAVFAAYVLAVRRVPMGDVTTSRQSERRNGRFELRR